MLTAVGIHKSCYNNFLILISIYDIIIIAYFVLFLFVSLFVCFGVVFFVIIVVHIVETHA